MTAFEEFWDNFVGQGVTKISDQVIDIFSSPLPDSVAEKYELSEVVTEFVGHHEDAKKFDKIAEFAEALQKNNKKVYDDSHSYFNEALVNYYCYKKDSNNLAKTVDRYIEGPLDYDILLKSFRKIVYYGQTELADKVIESKYEEVKHSPDLLRGAEYHLSIVKYHIELEKFYHSIAGSDQAIDWNPFKQKLAPYDFKYDDANGNEHLKAVESGILSENPTTLVKDLCKDSTKDRGNILSIIEMLFMKRMLQKGMSFLISGSIWYQLMEYWEDKPKLKRLAWPNYFKINPKSFRDYLNSISGFIMDYRFHRVMVLWGSSYVVDFLYEVEIFDQGAYEAQKKIISDLKSEFIQNKYNSSDLWEYAFVHDWPLPAGISPEDRKEEEELFINSFDINPKDIKFDPIQIPASVSRPDPIQHKEPPIKTYHPPRKIGRNEKVSVKYTDGTIKKDVKYKKVLKDLGVGNCELM